MRMKSDYILSLILLAAAVWGVLFLNADKAIAQDCNIEYVNRIQGAVKILLLSKEGKVRRIASAHF